MFLLFHVFLSSLLYSAKGVSAMDILPVICLGPDVALSKSKFIVIIINNNKTVSMVLPVL